MSLIDNILANCDFGEVEERISSSFKRYRKRMKLSRQQLAEESGVSYGSLRRFEETGKISLEGLLKLARRMDRLDPLIRLFEEEEFSTLDELRRSR